MEQSTRNCIEVNRSRKKREKHLGAKLPMDQTITEKLVIFVASSSVPNSIVENDEFRSLLLTLDTRYQVPSRTLNIVEIDRLPLALKGKIQS